MSAVVESAARLSKEAWRQQLRPLQTQVDASDETVVVDHLADFLGQISGAFLFYRSMPNEFGLDSLADFLGWERFATTRTPESGPLSVHSASGAMERHRLGYLQPVKDAVPFPLDLISVALVPALAFDTRGNRLGHGAGYYDELLSRISADCLRVGVIQERFIFDQLPYESHDIPMTHLASEAGVRSIEATIG